MMEIDVRGEPLGPIERAKVRFGRCPKCGRRLTDEVDGDLISSWKWTPAKCTARTFAMPTMHTIEAPTCRRCDACERWYLGKWTYWRKAE